MDSYCTYFFKRFIWGKPAKNTLNSYCFFCQRSCQTVLWFAHISEKFFQKKCKWHDTILRDISVKKAFLRASNSKLQYQGSAILNLPPRNLSWNEIGNRI